MKLKTTSTFDKNYLKTLKICRIKFKKKIPNDLNNNFENKNFFKLSEFIKIDEYFIINKLFDF